MSDAKQSLKRAVREADMWKLFALLCVVCLVGCVVESEPKRRRIGDTVSLGTITIVTTDNCIWCDRQKAVMDRMDLSEWKRDEVNHTSHPELKDKWPANSYPTIYIERESGTEIVVGFHRQSQLDAILK